MTRLFAARLAMIAGIIAVVACYTFLLWGSSTTDIPQERDLADPRPAANRVRLYLEVVGVDPIRDAMQIRLTLEPDGGGHAGSFALPDRDLLLNIAHDGGGETIQVHRGEAAPATTVELDLRGGDVTQYPLDAYDADLWLQCYEASPPMGYDHAGLPIDVTVWERALGFRVRTSRLDQQGPERLTFDIHRSRSFIFSAFSAYGAMLVLACGALTIGVLVVTRVRRAEPTLVGALGAVVFALPALRNALPATPPLGVTADVLVFFWTELAAVLSLALLVGTWARTGPRP